MEICWDYIYEMGCQEPIFIICSSKSTVNHSETQDPSLVADIVHFYGEFLDKDMNAKGISLKSIQLLTEAFFDDYRIWT